MSREPLVRPSRWILRSMEWDDSRARYPNIWHNGMPRHVLAHDRVACRLRLGDLIAIYYPESVRHPDRSEHFLGLVRVAGLRQAEAPGFAWIDLEIAHRLRQRLTVAAPPRRVFLCCDPGWPEGEVGAFRAVYEAAIAEGWTPRVEEGEAGDAERVPDESREAAFEEAEAAAESREPEKPPAERAPARAKPAPPRASPASREPVVPAPGERWFAGADYSGDMRDPRGRTWLAIVGLAETGELHLVRLVATGRSGLQASLRDPDRQLMLAEAIGLGFPFGLPQPFSETLLGGPFPEEGWWALARRLERVSWPDYLVAVAEFRDGHGELKRLADERAGAMSPLHRIAPDLGSRTYHGIRMIAEDRSRFALRPFERASGKLLFEVSPLRMLESLGLPAASRERADLERAVVALAARPKWPLRVEGSHRRTCVDSRDALEAAVAARCAAIAVLTGEADRTPEELAPGAGERVRREGWIYGLVEDGPAVAAGVT